MADEGMGIDLPIELIVDVEFKDRLVDCLGSNGVVRVSHYQCSHIARRDGQNAPGLPLCLAQQWPQLFCNRAIAWGEMDTFAATDVRDEPLVTTVCQHEICIEKEDVRVGHCRTEVGKPAKQRICNDQAILPG